MDELLRTAKEKSERIIELRRCVHQTPETGMHLLATRTLVTDELLAMGLSPQPCGESGVVALVEGAKPGKTFLLRADMDALPVEEETGLPFAATNGNMHACGHDCHVAMLLGAAKLLVEKRAELAGTVKLLFQPGEEIMEGAAEMVACGVLENPKVDAAMMMHIISGVNAPKGSVGVFGEGASYASVDWFRVDIQGAGGHGAQPQDAVNPLGIAADVYNHIHTLLANAVSPEDCAVMTVGELHGGHVANVIPDKAFMSGTLRTFEPAVRDLLKERLAEDAVFIARAHGGSAAVRYGPSAPCVQTDGAVRRQALESVAALLGPDMALDLDTAFGGAFKRVTSSEDFAYIAERVPAAVAWLMAGSEADGYPYPGHHPKADFSEDVFYVGSAVLARCAMDWLRHNPA